MINYSKLIRIIFTFQIFLIISSCGNIKYVPIENKETVRIEVRDSIRIIKDTVVIELPAESQYREVRDTISRLETTVAYSEASISSEGILTHFLTNKETSLSKEIIYQDRIVYKDSVRVEYQQVPYEVEVVKKVVPRWCWWLLGINVLTLLAVALRIYLKMKGI